LGNQLGGSGNTEENLITLYQNPTNNGDMKSLENQVRRYVEDTGDSVYYASTPYI
jgi:FPC/CPF motif-containing protein YcgG